MEFMPIYMDLKRQKAVVVGGGKVAARKAALLARACPHVVVVAPQCSDAMRRWLEESASQWIEAPFDDVYLDAAALVIGATNDALVNQAVYQSATARGIPVNIADQPDLCSFILPAIVDRSPAVIAISTGGRSPILARFLKAKLERVLPFALGELTALLGRWRQRVKSRITNDLQRRRFWEDVIEGVVGERALQGDPIGSDLALNQRLARSTAHTPGKVYLIGAGPGHPELMTLRGQRLLMRADVVVYDRLVGRPILELCRREAEMIYVGKAAADHAMSQRDIEALMIKHANLGKRVARLKGGDPFVFGRGGEELEALAKAQVDYEVVPGVSAGIGVAAYSGVPLTHRDHNHGVSFVSGDGFDQAEQVAGLVASGNALVVYMGMGRIAGIVAALQGAAMDASMPCMVVSAGTTSAQKTHTTTLGQLLADAQALRFEAPSMLIIGTVVDLQRTLRWYAGNGADVAAMYSAPQALETPPRACAIAAPHTPGLEAHRCPQC